MPLPDRLLIVGATSAIARAVAEELAAAGTALHLAARDEAEAERIGRDLAVRHGTTASWSRYEATDPDAAEAVLDAADQALGGFDGVLVAVGQLGDQARAERDPAHLRQLVEVNFTAVAHLLTQAARRLEAQGHGTLAAISSVAGDRGRASNYAYGAAKAGLSAFLEGLRGRLHEAGVHVLTVKPGPVDTPMTFGRDDVPLKTSPEHVAGDIVAALRREADVLYTPRFWRPIMAALRLLPASVFKRLPL
jgi:short-subunit dehydrogenase